MKLNYSEITTERENWLKANYHLPKFDREKVMKNTKESPVWVHFGAGNIFRAFQCNLAQKLLNEGVMECGITVTEGFDYEILEKMYRPHDNLSILATLKVDGTVEKTVVGSIMEDILLDTENKKEFNRMREIFSKDSLQIASFTITEKGYSLVNGEGELLNDVRKDFQNGPDAPTSYIGKVTSLLYTRYKSQEKPIAMVSMDNCSHNGDKLFEAIEAFAEEWIKNNKVEEGFKDYINNPKKVSFPWTMIDKITPRPDETVEKMLKEDGVEELEPVVTSKNTYVAPFVNAEECEYLVIEDHFPNGRPPLEKAGVLFTDRQTVDKVEKMKVCTCLNPLHTTLAIYGCLLGYTKISNEMKDPQLVKLVERIGYDEGLPVVINPGILDPKKFIDTVLQIRVANPFMPDTPQRIATDTSQKLSIRFGETVKAYMKSPTLKVEDLKMIPLVYAGWLRYLMAVDDEGREFTLSPDPLLTTVCPLLKNVKLGSSDGALEAAKKILEMKNIFGVDLAETGLQPLIIKYFEEMLAGPSAVRQTLCKYVGM